MDENRVGFMKNKKALFIVISALAVILIAGTAYMMLSGKNAREFYLDAESKNFKKYADQLKKAYKDFKEAQQPYLTGNYKIRNELTADIGQNANAGSSGAGSVNGVYDLIRKCKLVVDYKCNPIEKTGVTGLSLLLEKTPFIDAEIISKDNRLYFTVPVLTPDRYFSVDTNKLNEVYDRFDIPVKPSRVPDPNALANAVEFNGDEFDALASDYGKFIADSIKEAGVKYGKTVELTISGQKVKGREVSVTLSREESNALMKGLAEKAAGDETFAKLTYGNFAAASEIVDEAGIFQLFYYLDKTGAVVLNESEKKLLKALDVEKNLEGFKNEIGKLFDGFDFTDGLKMNLIIDKSGNILDRKAVAVIKSSIDGAEYEINVHTGTNSIKYNDYRNRFLEAELRAKSGKEKDSRRYFGINPAFTPSAGDGDGKGSIEIHWGADAEGGVRSATSARFDIDSATDELTLKRNSTVKYSVELQENSEGAPDKISGEIDTAKWKNNKMKTKNQTTAFTINAELPSFGISGFSAKLSLAREDRLEFEAFKLPEVAGGSVVNLNTATDEELSKVQDEILSSFGTFYMTNKPIFDAVFY